MLFKRRCKIEKGKLDIAPLIDVVLLLLIFFMLTSSMIIPSALSVNLPFAATAVPQKGRNIKIGVSREGTLSWQGKRIGREGLDERLERVAAAGEEVLIIIEADREVNHGAVVEVMDAAQRHGLRRLAIAAGVGPRY